MLKRLIILNSDVFSKADIEIEDCDSLQIVGPNNIGKSALIYALNFLYIIDGKQMTFSGNRTIDRVTLNHYFPSINSSYIIFEIFKQRYYSILIKKNPEGNIDYYKIDSDYKEDLYFNRTEKGFQLKKFDTLISEFSAKGIEFNKFQNRREVFNFVYQKGKRNNGVVWIDQNVSQDARGISNNFSKIYRYLINSKLINNETLKDSLIIADNRENEKVEFSKKNQKDIQSLLKLNSGIKIIKSIQRIYSEFIELVNQYKGKSKILSELVFAFNQHYSFTYSELGTKTAKQKQEREAHTHKLNEELNPKLKTLNQTFGSLKTQIDLKHKEIEEKGKTITEVKGYEDITFLNQAFFNLNKDRKNIESQITLIENQKLSSKEIENIIEKAKKEIEKISNQIKNYSNQLIHKISDNQKEKEIVNQILSDEISSLPKVNISKKISQVETIMKIFNGEIKLPKSIQGKPIVSIDELNRRINQLEKEKSINEKLLPIAKNLEKHQNDLAEINRNLLAINNKIEKIKSLPSLEKVLDDLLKDNVKLKQDKEDCEKEIKITETEIGRITELIKILSEDLIKSENRIREIQNWKVEIEQSGIKPLEYQTSDSLDNLYLNYRRNYTERIEIKSRKESLFEKLKYKTETSYANETDFIKFIDSEFATLEDKQKSIDGLLKNISTQFANPCRTIHSRFQEFNAFITNEFNSKLRKIKISDIDSLRIEIIENENLMSDIEKIMRIRDLTSELIFDDQSKNLTTLNKYLDNQTTILFKDLFKIKLHLEKKGQHKVVNLDNQIESDGTDKIIRLVIIMSIINRLVINDKENKIVIFVDEIGTVDEANRNEILNFCKDHNFIPISAAPLHPYDGFDKYYLVRRSKGKIVVSEKNGNVILRKSVIEA